MNPQREEENLLQYKDCLPANEGYYVADCACERCRKGLLNPYGDSELTSIVISAQKRFLCHNCYEEVQSAVRREKERKERKRNWKEYIQNCIAQSAVGGKRKHRKEKKRKGKRK